MKKLLFYILVVFLLLQGLMEVSVSSLDENTENTESLTNMRDGSEVVALRRKHSHPKIHHPRINCKYSCARRCRLASRKNVCTRACGTCCMRCHCVPPGTYGNKHACPCYASLKTHGNKPKCP